MDAAWLACRCLAFCGRSDACLPLHIDSCPWDTQTSSNKIKRETFLRRDANEKRAVHVPCPSQRAAHGKCGVWSGLLVALSLSRQEAARRSRARRSRVVLVLRRLRPFAARHAPACKPSSTHASVAIAIAQLRPRAQVKWAQVLGLTTKQE